VKDRKARFAELNEFVRARHGWLTSVPGEVDVTMQCLPGSTLPDDLRGLGYDVQEVGDGERILPTAITDRLTQNADGTLGPVAAGSTLPVTMIVHHAGVVRVRRYEFRL
jgi:hypothetical protein